ncbi:MAG TPA: hypothetical protein VK557_12180, partial [Pyrinomonadaceae bacterium]|nr:hypothetical protein [Pyrinomonadaceae bacterium]
GARTTFLPDVMQQIRFRKLQDEHPELKRAADSWDEHAREAYARGQDIQLHLHSQWSNAEYENGSWRLRGDWSLLNYDRDAARKMLSDSKGYLENVLRSVDSQYRCIAFRASALALAPSACLLSSLAALGIEIDVSVAGGVYLNNDTLQLDYRNCEETFLPYYPRMDDARRISNQQEPIVCVPLNHFYGSRRLVTKQNLALAKARLSSTEKATAGPARLDSQRTGLARVYEKLIAPALKRKHFVSDTGRLNYPLLCEMLASIRQRARESGLPKVPVVITNHPKDIRDWAGLERFVGDVADAEDVKFITLRDLAGKIRSGEFEVRTRST